MAATAVKTSETSDTIGKKALCALLCWSRPTLDRRLNSDPHFPVQSRGDRGGGWKFDAAQVEAYLAGVPGGAPDPVGDEDADDEGEGAYLVDLAEVRHTRRPGRAEHQGEATARQQRDQADADLKQDRLKSSRGELVKATAMRNALETILVELRSALLGMPDSLVKEFDLSERVGLAMKGKIEGMMRTSVLTLKQQLAVEISTAKE